jgi:aldehyde dehydrogenase (NAD+)
MRREIVATARQYLEQNIVLSESAIADASHALDPFDQPGLLNPLDLMAAGIASRLQGSFATGKTRPLSWRRAQLSAMSAMLSEQEARFLQALADDLGKGIAEALSTELAFVQAEIKHMLQNLSRWTSREKVSTPWLLQPGRSYIIREPLGVVLVIGAWNLPVPVLLGPVVAAVAAGNAVVMKPSELAPATSALIAELVPRYLDTETFTVVEGGVAETTALLAQKWGHIFYTGNATVGRVIATAAALNLTPVTLELGGKSPAYVHHDADLPVTAKRLVWAKWMNVGQVCVSPDYILVDRRVAEPLTDAICSALKEFYGSDAKQSKDYGRIVNTRHHDRLTKLLSSHGGQLIVGGGVDREARYIEPTVVMSPSLDSPLMQEEIFGPILPIVPVDGSDAAIKHILSNPKPLTLHVFTRDGDVVDRFERETSSGALVANDAVVNHRVHGLPFSGVGESGHGAYHGRAGFETFSHRKAVMRRPTWLDTALRYPPYTPKRLAAMRRLIGI